jgi:hypothetical protein
MIQSCLIEGIHDTTRCQQPLSLPSSCVEVVSRHAVHHHSDRTSSCALVNGVNEGHGTVERFRERLQSVARSDVMESFPLQINETRFQFSRRQHAPNAGRFWADVARVYGLKRQEVLSFGNPE